MSDNNALSLSQYFGSNDNNKTVNDGDDDDDVVDHEILKLNEKTNNLTIEDNPTNDNISVEPEICRIFAEIHPEPKDSNLSSFFDMIGSSNRSNNTTTTVSNNAENLISEAVKGPKDDGYKPMIALGTESDRRRDAWIPCEKTRQCLIACSTNTDGSFVPDRDMLTMPGILLEEDLGDTIMEAVTTCLGEAEASQRNVLTEADVTQDERGLRELMQAGCYKAAINLTTRLLTIYGQGRGSIGHPSKHSPHSLQLWFTRISLLIKTQIFSIAQSEAEPFGQLEKPDIFYQFYPEMYGSRPGSIASFSFRLLLAELPMHCGKPKDSLTKLYKLKSTIKQMLDNLKNCLREDGSPLELSESDRSDSLRLWFLRETRVIHSIINCALAMKDYELAIIVMEQLSNREGAQRHTLYSALGRLHLQVGDIVGAEDCFNKVKAIKGYPNPDLRDYVDRGLLAIAQGNFDEAYVCFQQASFMEPSNVMILNNMGVCLLYGGHLKEAISVLENAIKTNPVHALHESLLLNLCTLYDMESSRGRRKKFALLRQISLYQADAPTTILEKLYG